jgi:hypothetical protein
MARYNDNPPKMFDRIAFRNEMKKCGIDLSPESLTHLDEDEELNAFIEEHDSWEYQGKRMAEYILSEKFRYEYPHSIESVSEVRDILIEHNEWTPEMQKIYEKVKKEWTKK